MEIVGRAAGCIWTGMLPQTPTPGDCSQGYRPIEEGERDRGILPIGISNRIRNSRRSRFAGMQVWISAEHLPRALQGLGVYLRFARDC